jgi:nitrate reductase gamma subunit
VGALVFVFFYGSILFFIIATALRVKECVRVPVHVHWELYRGSSLYEAPHWWTEPPPPVRKKIGPMVLDLLFLREFYRRNLKFWSVLFLFHAGFYSLILWHFWLFVSALGRHVETSSSFGWIWGTLSTLVAFAGGLGILILRLSDRELRGYYPLFHFMKWIFVLLTLLGGLYAVDLHFKSSMPALLKYVREQATFADFEHKLRPAFGPALHIAFASLWLVYLPFSHVFQLFFRYYHFLRWDEVPNVRGGEIERRVKEHLTRPVGWAAPHIPSGKRWKDMASEFHSPSGAGSNR